MVSHTGISEVDDKIAFLSYLTVWEHMILELNSYHAAGSLNVLRESAVRGNEASSQDTGAIIRQP